MKKSLLILLASVAIAAVSCNKLEINDPSTSIYEIINDGGITKTAITIGLDADTKTVLDTISGPNNARTRKVVWKAGDKISVNGVESDPLGADYDGKGTARFLFKGTIGRPSESTPWKILYPASTSVDKITLSANQTLAEGDNISTDAMPMAAMVKTLKYPVKLQNLCAILSVELATGDKEYTVESIEITATGGEKINGDFSVNYAVDNSTTSPSGSTADANKKITVNCGTAALKPGRNIFANVVIPAGTYQGFGVKVSYNEGSTAKTKTESLGKPDKTLSITQGNIIALPIPFYLDSQTNPTINGYFVTPTGALKKDGSNWENAMGTTEFINMLIRPKNTVSKTKGDAINGKNFFLSAGTYQIQGQSYSDDGTLENKDGLKLEFSGYGSNVKINIFGGYAAGLTGTNLTRHDIKANETKFVPTAGERIMEIGNYVAVLVNGCTFTGARNTLDGSAIEMYPSGSSSSLTLENCKMTDNKRTDNNGVAACVHVAYGHFTAINCEFTNNKGRSGTVIRALNPYATVTLKNCLVANNTASHCCSGVSTGKSNVTIDGCTFRNNSSTWGGGALHIDSENVNSSTYPTMTVTNSVFENNSSSVASSAGGGAVSVQCGHFIGSNLVFKGNHTKYGGALALLDKDGDFLPSSSVDLTDCQFIGNYTDNYKDGSQADYYGGAIYVRAGKMTLRNTLVKDNKGLNGGAFDINRGCLMADNCTFEGNWSKQYGSLFWIGDQDNSIQSRGCVMLNNCYAVDNRSDNYWGGMIEGRNFTRIMAYNCTFKDNGGNGQGAINGSTCNLLVNCAMISNEPAIREDEKSLGTTNVWANTLLLNTRSANAFVSSNKGVTTVTMKGGCITGNFWNDNATLYESHTGQNFKGQNYSDLNITFDESTRKFTVGKKPAGYVEATSEQIKTMMQTDFPYTTPGPIDGKQQSGMGACDNLGQAFYNWLHSLGAL